MVSKKNLVLHSLVVFTLATSLNVPVLQAKADIIIPGPVPYVFGQTAPVDSKLSQAQALLQTFMLYHPDFRINHPVVYDTIMNNPNSAYNYINGYKPSEWESYYETWARNNPARAEYFRTNPDAYINWRNTEFGDNWKNFSQFLKDHPDYAMTNQYVMKNGKIHKDRGRHLGQIKKLFRNK